MNLDRIDKTWNKLNTWNKVNKTIKWRYYRHWGNNCHAGEGREGIRNKEGKVVDGSGGLHSITGVLTTHSGNKVFGEARLMCSRPIVMLARHYVKGNEQISAVLSYPNGLSIVDGYFWEIYPYKGDIARFGSTAEMEKAVVRELNRITKKRKVRK